MKRSLIEFFVAISCITLCGSAAAKSPPADFTRKLQQVVENAVAASPEVPGIAITYGSPGKNEEWSGAFGKTAIGGRTALSPSHPFRIASVTKIFVAATILRLHEQGKVRVTDTIDPYLSAHTAAQLRRGGYDPGIIRIDQLMTHTSGIADFYSSPEFLKQVLTPPGRHWTRAEQLEVLATDVKPVGAPGEAFHYSDSGYVVLGEIIERVTGKTLAAAVREELNFKALGLAATWWETTEPAPKGALQRVHQYQGELDVTDFDPSFDSYGGGGLISTTRDLAHFLHALVMGRIFSKPETLALALASPKVALAEHDMIHALVPFQYQFGKHLCWQHAGHWGTNAFFCPDIDVVIVYSVNQNGTRLYRELAEQLLPLVDAASEP